MSKLPSGFHMAKGHDAKIIEFNQETILLPISNNEAHTLIIALERHMRLLIDSSDYPEQLNHQNLLDNLKTCEVITFK